jgi:acetyl esterase/lipase
MGGISMRGFVNKLPIFFMVSSLLFFPGCGPKLARNVDLTKSLVYGKGWVPDQDEFVQQELLFDLIEPNDIPREMRPAVLMIHGGGFDGGTREDEELVALANDLATKGYVCFLTDYRLLPDVPPAPEGFDIIDDLLRLKQAGLNLYAIQDAIHAASVDAKTAMRHIRANAEYYGVDPNRIAILGESAGGFSAFGAGVSNETMFISDGPDFPVPPENNPGVNARPDLLLDLWASADFILGEFDASDPPIMIAHGLLDLEPGTFYSTALRIFQACQDAGIPVTLHTFPDQGHGAWFGEIDGQSLSDLCLAFLDERFGENGE